MPCARQALSRRSSQAYRLCPTIAPAPGTDPGAAARRIRREEVRANLLAGVTPSEAAIVDAAAHGVEVVRSHRRDIDALRHAAAVAAVRAPLLNLR